MKKQGFTLAEVLITLTIIGVVAVLTLPALMANTNEQQARTALKKLVNTMTMVASMNSATSGFDFSGITTASVIPTTDNTMPTDTPGSLLTLLMERTNVDVGASQAKKFAPPSTVDIAEFDAAVYLKDSTAIYFNKSALATDTKYGNPQVDGVMYGIPVIFDTNGSKGPNAVSNCEGKKITALTGDDSGDCSNKSKRYIKDQYMFRLRGSFTAPIGAASTWMLDDTKPKASDLDKGPGTEEAGS